MLISLDFPFSVTLFFRNKILRKLETGTSIESVKMSPMKLLIPKTAQT
jgi:hypothetical protein